MNKVSARIFDGKKLLWPKHMSPRCHSSAQQQGKMCNLKTRSFQQRLRINEKLKLNKSSKCSFVDFLFSQIKLKYSLCHKAYFIENDKNEIYTVFNI